MPEIQDTTATDAPHSFPLKVHHRDRKGRLLEKSPYTLFIKAGVQYFERPCKSGNLFFENNDPAGRVERVTDEKSGVVSAKFNLDAKHQAYTPELSGPEKFEQELAIEKQKNEALARELAAIKAEREQGTKLDTIKQEIQVQAGKAEAAAEKVEVAEAHFEAAKASIPTLKKG